MRMLVGPARVWAGADGGSPPDPGNPLDRPLVTGETFLAAYQGSFNTPSAFEYGGCGLAVSADGNSLYCGGLDTAHTMGRMSIPAIGGTASVEIAPVSVPGDSMSPPAANGDRTFGTLVQDDRLLILKTSFYDAPMTKWCVPANLSLTSFGTINGNVSERGASVRAISSGLGHLPVEWQGIFGGKAYAFGGSLSQVSQASCGPSFGTFDPDAILEGGGDVAMNDLLWYNTANPIEPYSPYDYPEDYVAYNSSGGTDYFAIQTLATGTAFIYPGSRSLLFIYGHGYGPYGNRLGECWDGSSVFSAPYRLQVVAYDLRELKKVQDGLLQPYQVQPYAWWLLGPDEYGALGECVYLLPGGFTFDAGAKKLYGCRKLSSSAEGAEKIHVWQIGEL